MRVLLPIPLVLACGLSFVAVSPARAAESEPAKPSPAAGSESGPGVVVCEPVLRGGSADVGNLGAGCSKWLHLAVGGQGRFGRTPLWSSVDRVRRELARPDFRISPDGAGKLARMLGVSHVVTGEIEGGADRVTLTYRLVTVPERTSVGAPITLEGSPKEVVTRLPAAARSLCELLGEKEPRLPVMPQDPADVGFVGRLGWKLEELPEGADKKRLQALSAKDAVAALLWMRPAAWESQGELLRATRDCIPLAPDNTLMLAAVGDSRREMLPPHSGHIARLLRAYPRNYLLVCTDSWTKRILTDWDGEQRSAALLVECAPENPEAWLTLGKAISDTADRIRNARLIADITPRELEAISELYARWVPAVAEAVKLDPQCGRAWQRLAVAATFAGAEELADQAFWESVALDTDEPFRVWFWGLEMYHPKWFDDAEKLARVARAAAAANYDQAGEALSIAEQLGAYGFPQLRMELLRRALVQAKQRAAAHPTLASAHFVLGEALNEVGRRAEARTAWEAAAALDREGTIRRDCEVRLAKYPAGTKAPEGPQPLPRVR